MTNRERLEKYIKENCSKCKFAVNKTIYTKCDYYERED